jgi:hypothetical protein
MSKSVKPIEIKTCMGCKEEPAVFDKIKKCYQDFCKKCKCTAIGCQLRALDEHRLCKTHRSCITVNKCKKCSAPCGTGIYCKPCYIVVPTCARKDCMLKACFNTESKSCFRFCQHHKCKTPACGGQCDNGVCDGCVAKSETIGVCGKCGKNKSPKNTNDNCWKCQNDAKVCKSCAGPTGTYKDDRNVIQKYEYCVQCC